VAPGYSALVAAGSGIVLSVEATLGGTTVTLTDDEPMPATGDGAAPAPAGASDASLRGKMWSRTRPIKAPSSGC
jgi:hypothetical protein